MPASIEPQQIDNSTWYYEMTTHLLLVREVRDKQGNYIQTEQFKLPWRQIEASRRRHKKR
jgi:hypothetical protein